MALDVWLVAGFVVLAAVANQHYPIRHWLLFFYARMWALGLLLVVAALSAGWRLQRALLPEPGPLAERVALALPLGVLVFAWGVFVGGLLGLFGRAFFFGWPAALIAATAFGARGTFASARRAWRRLRPFGFALVAPRGPIEAAAGVLIALSLALIYLAVMTPGNAGADAHWYHLSIAEHYAVAGRIRPFAEGWYLGAYPQLASLLYTWAFQAPGELSGHVALAAHLEWLLFLATLGALAPLARRLSGGTRVPYAAAALFLFPGIFLYDSSLVVMSDHVLAFWAAPLALATFRLRRCFGAREAVVAGLLAAGAASTKYQGSYLCVPAALAVAALAIRHRRARPLAAWVAAVALASSLHWLKNLAFYGDPFYPLLHRVLAAHPFHRGAGEILARSYFPAQFALAGPFWSRVGETLGALVQFSFVPHDWSLFHGARPVFGSLFTLLLPALALARARRSLWELAAATHVGLLVWYVSSHQDRFLQALLPWMAAWTAAMLVAVWQRARGRARTRAALAALVALQIVWGADVPFIRSHAMLGDSPLKAAVDQIAAGHEGRYRDRFRIWGGLQDVGRALPRDAIALAHAFTERLGLGVRTVGDATGWQGAIDYLGRGGGGGAPATSPRATVNGWRALGVTHLVWRLERGATAPDELAREAVFQRAAPASARESFGGYTLAPLPSEAAADADAAPDAPTRIAWLGCGADPPTGLYSPVGLADRRPDTELDAAALAADPTRALGDANAIVLRPGCPGLEAAVGDVSARFRRAITAGDVALWIR